MILAPAAQFARCHAALALRFAENTQHHTSKVLRQNAALATKNESHLLKTMLKYCPCHAKQPLPRYETRRNITKCHVCHEKRHYNPL